MSQKKKSKPKSRPVRSRSPTSEEYNAEITESSTNSQILISHSFFHLGQSDLLAYTGIVTRRASNASLPIKTRIQLWIKLDTIFQRVGWSEDFCKLISDIKCQALEKALKICVTKEDKNEVNLRKAKRFFRLKRYAEAEPCFQESWPFVQLTDPDVNYTAWLRFLNILEFTDCLLALNKPKDALDKLIFAEEIDPEKDEDITKKIHWKKAKCHMLLKQHECALKEYLISEIVLLSAAKSSVIPDNLARFYIEFGRCCQAVSKDENSAVLCINNAMIIGHFEKALVYCEKLRKEIVGVRLEKEEYTIHTVLLYDIFVKQKDYSTALAYLETFTKCYAHQTQHHWTTTVNTLTLSSEDQALLFSKMAFCQRKLHRIGTAIQSYKSSISYYKASMSETQNIKSWYEEMLDFGQMLRDHGYLMEAKETFNDVLEEVGQVLDFESVKVLNLQLGLTLLCLDDITGAHENYQMIQPYKEDTNLQSKDEITEERCRLLLTVRNTDRKVPTTELINILIPEENALDVARIIKLNGQTCMTMSKDYLKAHMSFETVLMIFEHIPENAETYSEEVRIHFGHCKLKLDQVNEALDIFLDILLKAIHFDAMTDRMKGVLLSVMYCEHKLGLTNMFNEHVNLVIKLINVEANRDQDIVLKYDNANKSSKVDIIQYKIGQVLRCAYSLEHAKHFETHLNNAIKTESDIEVMKEIVKLPKNLKICYKNFHNAWNISKLLQVSCDDLNRQQ